MIVNITVDGVAFPTPQVSGLDMTHNKIWSDDAGRTASGRMVGTVKAVKRSIKLRWPRLTGARAAVVVSASARTDRSYVTANYTGITGAAETLTGYFSSPAYTVVRGGMVENLTVELIEQ